MNFKHSKPKRNNGKCHFIGVTLGVAVAAATGVSIWGITSWQKEVEETKQKEIDKQMFDKEPLIHFFNKNMVWIAASIIGLAIVVIVAKYFLKNKRG